jgi:DNA invertase Pin-like site-specific DNA recombinase
MSSHTHQKVNTDHLKRDAYLYIRQSSLRQVVEHTESTKRQYALKQRAVALGWPKDRVIVIDSDLGQSGASTVDREGFRKLVAEVSVGRAGIVLGLEVSRLARNCTDWHRLLEICALSDTLILDEDGLYNPGDFNDRLLLGLKGTMSEAELHLLRARLQGGIRNKARRGELRVPLPIGLVYDSQDRVVLDPDRQVQQTIRAFFSAYERIGSACGVVRHFREQKLLLPRRVRSGLRKGEVVWGELTHSRALQVLHNPRYAGAFAFGRTRVRKKADGLTSRRKLPQDEWHTLIPASHPGYITWDQYLEHRRRLREYAQAHGLDRKKSPPGEGPALLQGIVMCGVCGRRMIARYHTRRQTLCPNYLCQREGIQKGEPCCQKIQGDGIDAAIGDLLLETLQPQALELAWAVQQEVRSRIEEADELRRQQVERARYEAEVAERRFMKVDPNHRLVADELEADWNAKLRDLAEAQEEYERQRQADAALFDEKTKARVMSLATDFPKLWSDPQTSDRERKRMVRLLIEDVTLIKSETVTAHVRFRGGATRTLDIALGLPAPEARRTSPEVLAEIDRLLDEKGETEIAAELNRGGYRSGTGAAFTPRLVKGLRYKYGIKTRYDRLRDTGLLTLHEVAEELGVSAGTVKAWRREGLLTGHRYNDRDEYLYEPIGDNPPVKTQGRKLAKRRRDPKVASDLTNEVQHAV